MTQHSKDRIVEAAIQWALEKLGSRDYPMLCYAFVEDAYEKGARIVLDGKGSTAHEAAEAYGACTDGPPPRGSYVFYDASGPIGQDDRNWGHMGISLGGGRVVHTWGEVRVDDLLAIQDLPPAPGWTRAVYRGWAPVELVLEGMREA